MTRTEHMQWCKERALALVDDGDLVGALASMASDVRKHPDTAGNPTLTMLLTLVGPQHLGDPLSMRRFIEGFA